MKLKFRNIISYNPIKIQQSTPKPINLSKSNNFTTLDNFQLNFLFIRKLLYASPPIPPGIKKL